MQFYRLENARKEMRHRKSFKWSAVSLLWDFPIAKWSQSHIIEKQIQTCGGIKSRTNAYAPHEFASELNATLARDGAFVVAVVWKSQRARVKYTPTTVDTINASKLKLIYVVITAWIHVNTTIITIIFGYLAVSERQQGVWWRWNHFVASHRQFDIGRFSACRYTGDIGVWRC